MSQGSTEKLTRTLTLVLTLLLLFIHTASAGSYTNFIHTDVLGNIVAVTDEYGNIISREHVTPFGSSRGKTNPKTPCPWARPNTGSAIPVMSGTGISGLTYMQARYYDPVIGRFMGVDPVGFRETEPALFNRYAYANNNPYKFVDPNGEYVELGFEAASIGLGAHSFSKNLAAGEYGPAVVDGLGIVADFIGAILPGVPGVVGIGLSITENTSASSKIAQKANHIFNNLEHKMGSFLEKYKSEEEALQAIQKAAQDALESGKMNIREDGVNTVTRVNIDGMDVDIVGGREIDGSFEIGSASRRDIEE